MQQPSVFIAVVSKEINKRKISEILAGLKLQEVSTYHLLTKSDLRKMQKHIELQVQESKTDYKEL